VSNREAEDVVMQLFNRLMADRGTPVDTIDRQQELYESGYGLDSMDTATFSAMLAEHLDDDPYSAGIFPRNIEEVAAFYASLAARNDT
jgi:hypothetical protein